MSGELPSCPWGTVERRYALALGKIEDAKVLVDGGRFSSALVGYAVEIGLKACIAKQIASETIPDKRFIVDVHTHDLVKLVNLAGLRAALNEQVDVNPEFRVNWGLVAEWTPERRYETIDRYSAQLMLAAITDAQNGVMPWVMRHW